MNGTPKLQVDAISKTFETNKGLLEALKDASLHIPDGGFLTLIGHSGCGKSTLLNVIAGLEDATSGQILIDGVSRDEPGPDRGMVFQSYTLFPWLTVRRNIEFGPRIKGMSAGERRELVEHYLGLVKLPEFADSYPKELSGGMRQRVALARALANRPEVLLMDEPFGALDAETREGMHELLLGIREREPITILFITHDVDEAILLSERIGIMSSRPGRIREEFVINLPYPRSADLKMTTDFLDLKRDLVARFKAV